ncbi:MAG: PAS domain S-box protein [Bacteroidales bacterium]|nr:PAS domain S-box protein [Bacteroidales bacterium]
MKRNVSVKELERQLVLLLIDLEKYKAIFDDAPIGIFRATTGGRYVEANNTLARLLGYENSTDLVQTIKDIGKQVYSQSKERRMLLRQLFKESSIIKHETLFKRKDGVDFPVSLILKLIKNDENKPLYISGIVEDITLRKKTQENLVAEHNHLRKLIDNIPDYIYLKDAEGNYIITNSAFAKLVNVPTPDELSGMKNISVNNNEFAGNFLKDDEKIMKKGKPVINREDSGFNNITGKYTYAYISKIPIINESGKLTGLIAIGRDVTDLKQAEQQITDSQANLQTVLESTGNAIWSLDKGYRITTANTHFQEFFKFYYKKEIKTGDPFLSLLPDTQKSKWKKIINKAFKGEKWTQDEYFSSDELITYYELSVSPVINLNNKISGVTFCLNNINERKIAEEEIKESEERFRQLAENTNDAFILTNRNNIIWANPGFEKIYKRTVGELLKDGSVLEQSVHPEDKKRFLKFKDKAFTGRNSCSGLQYRIMHPDGSIRWLWSRSFPVHNASGKIYRFVVVISDITEHYELQSAISQVKTQQKAILDNIPYLAWLKDSKGRYISVNEPFACKFGLKAENIIGKTDFEITTRSIAQRIQKSDADVMKKGKKQLIEEIENTPEGRRWVETFKTPIFNDKKKLIGITGISRDITERKKMDEKSREREKHFDALLQNSSDSITILDNKGIIIFENSPRNKISDFDIDELLGKSIFDIIHPDETNTFKALFKEIISKKDQQIKKEYRSLHKNKKWIWVESIFSNQLDNPTINGIVVNSRDISERKMGELKERVYHDNLVFLSNSALDLIGLSSKEDIYRYIADKLYSFLENALVVVSSYNEERNHFQIECTSGPEEVLKAIPGLLKKDLTGLSYPSNRKLSDLSNAGAVKNLKDNLELFQFKQIKFEDFVNAIEYLNIHKVYNISLARHNKLLGNITILTLYKSIIKFKHIIETFIHQVSVALHRSQLEYELLMAKEKAEESDKLKTAFLANMSHEIRTPMNGILGFAEMLNDESLSPGNRKKYLDIIHSSGKMLINLIDDIIDFAKIEAGQINIVPQDFSLNALLSQVHTSFQTEQLKKDKSGVKLIVRKAFNNENCFIHADPNRLRQIFTNLIGNAFKFTDQGFIEFGYKKARKKMLQFYVKDTGIGIPADKLKVIFDRFIQADSSSTRKYGGSGLGLAISKGFVELLGGKMWAESKVDEGSTFFFTIPHVPGKLLTEEEISKRRPKKSYHWEGKVFLIAEDDKFSYKFLESFLKQTKAKVLHAIDGKAAIDICRNNNIDLVLMDIQMPEMNGLQATEEIKKFKKSLPVIAQTANAITEEKQKCFEAGCDDFITKPVNIAELYSKIDKWLSGRHS